MPHVKVDPHGVTIAAEVGETVMAAAIRDGYWWPTVCEGMGDCHVCFTQVIEGEGNLSPIEGWEQEGLDLLGPAAAQGRPGQVRLACQARVLGDVRLLKRGVRPRPSVHQ